MELNRREFVKTLSYLAAASSVYMPAFADNKASNAFPELTAKGSYGALGYEHGKTFASLIKKNLDL